MKGSPVEVFITFLRLGLTSFGGPIAHLGYFRRELIEKREWFSEAQYAQLLAICQFLPGPASSQLGFTLGLIRAGWAGALAAFVAFTLPSAVLPLWGAVSSRTAAARAIAGINAAVVGFLAAALYDPIWVSAVRGALDVVSAGVGFALLSWRKMSAIFVVLWCIVASVFFALATS